MLPALLCRHRHFNKLPVVGGQFGRAIVVHVSPVMIERLAPQHILLQCFVAISVGLGLFLVYVVVGQTPPTPMAWEGAMTIADKIALAFALFSLIVVFVRLRRAYKQNLPRQLNDLI